MLTYIVVEAQIHKDGTVGTLINAYDNIADAQNKYYTILAAAAKSNLYKHAAYLFTDDGYIDFKCFQHGE